jgi:hypothetical protein
MDPNIQFENLSIINVKSSLKCLEIKPQCFDITVVFLEWHNVNKLLQELFYSKNLIFPLLIHSRHRMDIFMINKNSKM